MNGMRAVPGALGAVVLGCGLAALVLVRVAAPVRVMGASMAPTLQPGDVVLVLRWPSRIRSVRAGEIVVADVPAGRPASGRVIKRVARIEGRPGGPRLILRGDNPPASADSRIFGPVPLGAVRGVVVWRLYPRWGPVSPGAGADEATGRRRTASPAGR